MGWVLHRNMGWGDGLKGVGYPFGVWGYYDLK